MSLFDKEALSVNVATRLRELREERKMSMRALAQKSGLSANALSVIERGKTSPSVSTLYKLADALGVPITAFFGPQSPRSRAVFVKANQRTRVPFLRGVWEGLGGEQFLGRVEPFMLTLESGASSGIHSIVHTGHEFVFCLRGGLEYLVENQVYNLEAAQAAIEIKPAVAIPMHVGRHVGALADAARFESALVGKIRVEMLAMVNP